MRVAGTKSSVPPAAILDVDGTLVDSNYHHAIAWYRAFRQSGIVLPLWRIHRYMGMGGEQLVPELIGEEKAEQAGDDVKAAETPLYMSLIEEVSALEGARELIDTLKERGQAVVLASSSDEDEVDHYIDLLGVREVADGWTTSGDVENTKPEPDLVEAAIEKAGKREAVLVGDSIWDCKAAVRAGIDCVGVLTGGFCERELTEAGAGMVFESLPELRERLDETPLSA
jgi:HAD superfamily hydrolase (TIGR01509 family)